MPVRVLVVRDHTLATAELEHTLAPILEVVPALIGEAPKLLSAVLGVAVLVRVTCRACASAGEGVISIGSTLAPSCTAPAVLVLVSCVVGGVLIGPVS